MGAFSLVPFFTFLFTFGLGFVSCFLATESIAPNFTATNLQFIDNSGAFLVSRNGIFKLAIYSPGQEPSSFYLCVLHALSSTVIWSANRDSPISRSGVMALTVNGIAIFNDNETLVWSTPRLNGSVQRLELTDMGNLVLLDKFNASLWDSFDHPTDTIVIGQRLNAGTMLSSGDYRLLLSSSDAIMQWNGQTYWKLTMENEAYTNSNYVVEYMTLNRTGLFLFGKNGTSVVIEMVFPAAEFRIAYLSASGHFIISTISGSVVSRDFTGPADSCAIPFVCGKAGLCTDSGSNSPVCSCPPSFRSSVQNSCVPTVGSSLPVACNSSNNDTRSYVNTSDVSYSMLGYGMGYFTTDFSEPIKFGVNLSVCQDSCTSDCSCLGIFYGNSSGSCFLIQNELGSIMASSVDDLLGYIKVLVGSSPAVNINGFSSKRLGFPVIAIVLLPFTGCSVLVVCCFLWWRKLKLSREKEFVLGNMNPPSSGDLDAFYIPGLPQRFDYEELELATENFKTQIGSGGFGSVYKGTLPDKSVVAVKKITNLGVQGKRDFCTEIAVIGNIHHVNLVKLRGFCAQGRQRLLVYEYMNRGSLDRTLFGNGPVLEWQERYDIAVGTARGLAYLHTGCEQKIIHCDVKPENILLHDNFQAKISDFGLSKLLSPEQSSLFTTMRGTRGYLAPEWLTNSAISEKTDVYSFGMVLLELVSGRKNCQPRSRSHSLDDSNSTGGHSQNSAALGPVYFPLLALEMHEQGRYLELADPRLEGRVTSEDVRRLVCIALCCVHEEPMLRPNMVTVVGMLEGGIPFRQPRIESLNFLRFYGRRYAEASMIEEQTERSDAVLFPKGSTSSTSTSGSRVGFSYISSHQVSGPR